MRDMGYAPLEDDRRERKTPVGGVPLFPGLQPVSDFNPDYFSNQFLNDFFESNYQLNQLILNLATASSATVHVTWRGTFVCSSQQKQTQGRPRARVPGESE